MRKIYITALIFICVIAGTYVYARDKKYAEIKKEILSEAKSNIHNSKSIDKQLPEYDSAIEDMRALSRNPDFEHIKDDALTKIDELKEKRNETEREILAMIEGNQRLIGKYMSLPRQFIWNRKLDALNTEVLAIEEYIDIPNKAL